MPPPSEWPVSLGPPRGLVGPASGPVSWDWPASGAGAPGGRACKDELAAQRQPRQDHLLDVSREHLRARQEKRRRVNTGKRAQPTPRDRSAVCHHSDQESGNMEPGTGKPEPEEQGRERGNRARHRPPAAKPASRSGAFSARSRARARAGGSGWRASYLYAASGTPKKSSAACTASVAAPCVCARGGGGASEAAGSDAPASGPHGERHTHPMRTGRGGHVRSGCSRRGAVGGAPTCTAGDHAARVGRKTESTENTTCPPPPRARHPAHPHPPIRGALERRRRRVQNGLRRLAGEALQAAAAGRAWSGTGSVHRRTSSSQSDTCRGPRPPRARQRRRSERFDTVISKGSRIGI